MARNLELRERAFRVEAMLDQYLSPQGHPDTAGPGADAGILATLNATGVADEEAINGGDEAQNGGPTPAGSTAESMGAEKSSHSQTLAHEPVPDSALIDLHLPLEDVHQETCTIN